LLLPSPVFRPDIVSDNFAGDFVSKEVVSYGCSSYHSLFVILILVVPAFVVRRKFFGRQKSKVMMLFGKKSLQIKNN